MGFTPMTLPTNEYVKQYEDYLKSEYWAALKELYAKLYPPPRSCDCCGQNILDNYFELHHLKYDNLGKLTVEIFDLLKVCKSCHQEISRQEKEGLSSVEAVDVAREVRLEVYKHSMKMLVTLHHDWKRLQSLEIEGKNEVDGLVTALKEKGIIDTNYNFDIKTLQLHKSTNT